METFVIILLVIALIVSCLYARNQYEEKAYFRKLWSDAYSQLMDVKRKLIEEQIKNQEK